MYAQVLKQCANFASVQGLDVAEALALAVEGLAEDTVTQMGSALQAVCSDFRGSQFLRVRDLPLKDRMAGN